MVAPAGVDGTTAPAHGGSLRSSATSQLTYPGRIRVLLVGLALFLITAAAFRAAGATQTGGDSLWVAHTSWSVLTDGDLELSEYQTALQRTAPPGGQPAVTLQTNGGIYNFFPWGASVVATPFVAADAAQRALRGQSIDAVLRDQVPATPVERNVAALFGGATVALMFLLLWRRTRSAQWATIGALVFAFGTGVASTTTRALWIQGPALLVIVAWLVCVGELRRNAETRWTPYFAGGAGVLGVLAYATRPTLLPLVLIGGVLAWRVSGRSLAACASTTALAALAFFVVNQATYATWQPAYYSSTRAGWSNAFGEAFAANLVSPARGLLVWSPVVIIGIVAYVAHVRRAPLIDHCLMAWVVLHLLVVSVYSQWWAGYSVGARFMLDVVPALFYLAAAAPVELRRVAPRVRTIAYVGMGALVLWSIAINVDAMIRPAVNEWNTATPAHPSVDEAPGRVWNLRSGQPFAEFPHRHAPNSGS